MTTSSTQQKKTLLFTLTHGRSGTNFLADLLKLNLPAAQVHHERLAPEDFGLHTPDLSHKIQFNCRGNNPHIRQFWQKKFKTILAEPEPIYVETSHLLCKAGLLENMDLLQGRARVVLLPLWRDIWELLSSYRNRKDFQHPENYWVWYLDPKFPRVIVPSAAYLPLGTNGICLWYIHEMTARIQYYQNQDSLNLPHIHWWESQLNQLNDQDHALSLIKLLDPDSTLEQAIMPPRSNCSTRVIPWFSEEKTELESLMENSFHANPVHGGFGMTV